MENVKMTFEKFDERMSELLAVERREKVGYFPTKEEVLSAAKSIENKERFLLTLEYLLETNPAPATVEEEKSTSFIKQFISENLSLFDSNKEILQAKRSNEKTKKA